LKLISGWGECLHADINLAPAVVTTISKPKRL